MKTRVTYLLVTFSLLVSNSAWAVAPLSAQELALHCKHYAKDNLSLDGEFCARYIQGFIDGAVVTDARVMLNVEKDLTSRGSFVERAERTRTRSRDDYQRAARYAEYCLGDPVPLKEVVTHAVAALETMGDDIDAGISARDVVYEMLKEQYPCEAEESN